MTRDDARRAPVLAAAAVGTLLLTAACGADDEPPLPAGEQAPDEGLAHAAEAIPADPYADCGTVPEIRWVDNGTVSTLFSAAAVARVVDGEATVVLEEASSGRGELRTSTSATSAERAMVEAAVHQLQGEPAAAPTFDGTDPFADLTEDGVDDGVYVAYVHAQKETRHGTAWCGPDDSGFGVGFSVTTFHETERHVLDCAADVPPAVALFGSDAQRRFCDRA